MNPILFVLCMIVGLAVYLLLFIGRVVAVIASIVAGMSGLSMCISWMAWSSTHRAMQWIAFVKTADMFGLSMAVVLIAGYFPWMLLQDRGVNPAPRRGRPAQ